MKLKVLDLFSGIGGFSLGLERTGGFETVAFCEIEEFPRKVLKKHWPEIPCFNDIRSLKGSDLGPVDVICGGYPCQPFSTAGKRRGEEDDRHLWPEFSRLVDELRPSWVIGENVAGHISMGLDDVLSDLEGQGYACRTFVIPACAVDAKHRRDRVWTVAHASGEQTIWQGSRGFQPEPSQRGKTLADSTTMQRDGSGEHRQSSERQIPQHGKRSGAELMADTKRQRLPRQGELVSAVNPEAAENRKATQSINGGIGAKWSVEPDVGKLDDGISRRLVGGCIDANAGWLQVSRSENAEECLRGLRLYKETLRSPQKRGLDGQHGVKYQNALFFVSHVIASQAGRPGGEEITSAMHRLWSAVLSRKSAALQYAPHQIEALWKPLPCETADWVIVAACHGCFWSEWSEIPRVASGVPRRVDRLKALGNAVVPQIPEMIGHAILEAEK